MSLIQRQTGRAEEQSASGETYKCFMPFKLPPSPPIQIEQFYSLLEKAAVSLGELNGIRANLPDASLFISTFSKKEAILSSQIEGTQSSLSDFLLFENGEKPQSDEKEAANYMSAMNYGLKRIQSLPLSRRLICEIHAKLLTGGRGQEKTPGEFRISQTGLADRVRETPYMFRLRRRISLNVLAILKSFCIAAIRPCLFSLRPPWLMSSLSLSIRF